MQVDLVAELPHYRDHALPVWLALPEENRGRDWGVGPAGPSDNLLLVASYSDLKRNFHRKCVYMEHGAGQGYVGLPTSVEPFYCPVGGGAFRQHRNVALYLCPSDEVAKRWKNVNNVPAVAVGSPRLDAWHAGDRGEHESHTVAITFHFEPLFEVTAVVPELTSAFRHYFRVLNDAAVGWRRQGWHVIGTTHPRARAVTEFWQTECRETVEFVSSSTEVIDRAALLVADNTSMQAEFMSLGRGVVWLNHPAYRKDVEHGGRFWQWPDLAGVQIDTPDSLVRLDLGSVPPSTFHPYAFADGRAAERAVSAILSLA